MLLAVAAGLEASALVGEILVSLLASALLRGGVEAFVLRDAWSLGLPLLHALALAAVALGSHRLARRR